MDTRKHLCSLARMLLPALGFVLICVGAYLMSHHNAYNSSLRYILDYFLIACGLWCLLTGVFWTICHGMKRKRQHQRSRRHHTAAHIHVYTVDRPSFHLPSYEESQQNHTSAFSATAAADYSVLGLSEDDLRFNLAPPLYTQDISEAPDDTFNHEEPPAYSEMAMQPHREPQGLPQQPEHSRLDRVPCPELDGR
ncbi:transmembrane protein 252-like [Salmo trutta]|uniref:transmembrane protein 252-like n=1 Tax=Salmo trutta TaxID=8032 RepID=UPI001130D99B|nr:transmembrane protein 252 [Salmo trutta]